LTATIAPNPAHPLLILASASPQRAAILNQLGIPFKAVVSGVEEIETGDPKTVAEENARRKADAVGGDLVLGADTLVALDQIIYGKPQDEGQARETLLALSGRTHTVWGGIAIKEEGEIRSAVAATRVTFRAIDPGLLAWYVEANEWRDRAGGYAIQGRGAALVAGIEGDFWNVVGLPVPELLNLRPALLSG
jgi:nucleoside triphosphate pyrophosphatase